MYYIYNSFYDTTKPLMSCISIEIQKLKDSWKGIIYFKINKYCYYKEGQQYSLEYTKEEIKQDLIKILVNYIKERRYKDIILLKEED